MRKEKFVEFKIVLRWMLLDHARRNEATLEYNDLINYTIGFVTVDDFSDINFTGAQLRKFFDIPKEVWAQVHGLPGDH